MQQRVVMIALAVVLTAASATALVRHNTSVMADVVAAPSDAETRTLLMTKWKQALREGKTAFCADTDNPGLCESYWDEAGGAAAVPRREPRVAVSNAAESYRWLTVCGTTGRGRKYESEFVTTRSVSGGPVRVVLPVFWWTQRFRGVFVEGSEPTNTIPHVYPDLC